jgi:hypothetical protein
MYGAFVETDAVDEYLIVSSSARILSASSGLNAGCFKGEVRKLKKQ